MAALESNDVSTDQRNVEAFIDRNPRSAIIGVDPDLARIPVSLVTTKSFLMRDETMGTHFTTLLRNARRFERLSPNRVLIDGRELWSHCDDVGGGPSASSGLIRGVGSHFVAVMILVQASTSSGAETR